MSLKHPIIAVTGSSGAGTSTFMHAFERVFAQLNLRAAFVEGDAFHAYDREQMQAAVDMFEQPAAGPAASEVNPADMAAVRARRAQLDAFFQAQNEDD